MMRDFGRRLRATRITAGYEYAADFAKEIGVEPPAYRKYERGESMPPLDVLGSIQAMTGTDLNWLLLGLRPENKRKLAPGP